MVLRAATPDQEQYVLPVEKFRKRYEVMGIEIDELEGISKSGPFMQKRIRQLVNRGFKLYRPRPDNRRYIYKLKPEDIEIIPRHSFISDFGAVQPVRDSDYLACPEDAREIYLMPEVVVNSGDEIDVRKSESRNAWTQE